MALRKPTERMVRDRRYAKYELERNFRYITGISRDNFDIMKCGDEVAIEVYIENGVSLSRSDFEAIDEWGFEFISVFHTRSGAKALFSSEEISMI